MTTIAIIAIILAFAPHRINPVWWLGRLYGKINPPTKEEKDLYKQYGSASFFLKRHHVTTKE